MKLSNALQLNRKIIKESKSPHQRDLARMRRKILKKVRKRVKLSENESVR